MMDIKIGDLVETAVYVLNKRIPMSKGIVVAIHPGYCEVDIMSLHGGAPWIIQETTFNLRVILDR
jgi:hypothetical protein